jgi:hypothetical protein
MSKGNTKGRGKPAGTKPASAKQTGGQKAKAPAVAPQQADSTANAQTAPKAASKPAVSRPASRRKKGGINWIWVVAAIGGAALVGALIFNITRELQLIGGVQNYGPFPVGIHVSEPINYAQRPPVGGEHRPNWQNCGIYTEPVQDELAVHSLEHGAVWLTYRPDLPADQVEQLKSLVRGKTYTLLSPYPDQPSPVAASAWGAQLTTDSAGDTRLAQFISKYRQGAQTPEPGAACVGGVGSPDER